MNKLPERLKELRTEAKLSMDELAVKTGISKSSISNWELGKTVPNVEHAFVLAKFFDVTSDYLIGMVDY